MELKELRERALMSRRKRDAENEKQQAKRQVKEEDKVRFLASLHDIPQFALLHSLFTTKNQLNCTRELTQSLTNPFLPQ